MTKGERTRQFIIEQTAPLFNCKGFAGTSLTDLTEKTRLTKGALYGNFYNKEEIAREAFQYAIQKVRQCVQSKLEESKTYKGKLLKLLEFYCEYVFSPPIPGGCPLLNAAVEADDIDSGLRPVVVQEMLHTVDFIRDLLKKGIQAGEFKRGTGTKELAYTIFCVIEGGVMFSRVERSPEPMNIVVKHCKKLLEQISK